VPTDNGLADCLTCALAELVAAGFHRAGAHWTNAARQNLSLRVISGPSAVDRATAAAVCAQWNAVGVATRLLRADSDVAAAQAVALSRDDVAVYAKPTTTTPSVAARSWSGAAFADTFPSGFRSPDVTSLFTNAISNFNSAAATATWLQLDQAVLHSYWIRPLYTVPSLVEWSNSLAGVTGSISLPGFVDQLTGWNTTVAVSG
jgi:hypothetical protein